MPGEDFNFKVSSGLSGAQENSIPLPELLLDDASLDLDMDQELSLNINPNVQPGPGSVGGLDIAESMDPSEDVETLEDASAILKQRVAKMKEQVGEGQSRKVQIVVGIFVLVVVGIFILFGAMSKKEQGIKPVAAPYTQFTLETFEVPATTYSDQMKIKKMARVENSSISYYFMGTPKNFKEPVVIQVSSAVYNAVTNDQTVAITYQVITLKMGDKVVDCATNLKVKTKGEE